MAPPRRDEGIFVHGIRPGVAPLAGLDFHQVADRARWPKLAALRERIEADPAFIDAMALENGENASGNGACRGHVELREVIDRFGAT